MRNFKKFLALVLATMMVLGGMVTVSAAEEKAVADYEAAYLASAEELAALGIVKGTASLGDNKYDYALSGDVTRWQMALFIARIMSGETNDGYWNVGTDNTTPFDDVVNYFGAITYVTDKGVIKGKGYMAGVGDNCFDPDGKITYAEALTMAVRATGELQLQYPDGFMTAAEELGLTDGLEDLKQDAELTRGQMIQILYNLLFVKRNGAASFAEQNFGLETAEYVLVATNKQAMPEAAQVEKTGYVALAKLNADGTYQYNDYLYVDVKELGITAAEAERMIGYSWTVASFDGLANVYAYEMNDVETYLDYGSKSDKIKTATGLNGINNPKFVTIDGKKYELVTSYSNLNNKSTYNGNATELIVHSLYEADKTSAYTYYRYDLNGNIYNKEGTAIAIFHWQGQYLVKDSSTGIDTYRLATEDDFAKCAVSIDTGIGANIYGIVTKNTSLTTTNYGEITMIDDNGDGVFDRAIYIPYTIGYFETTSANQDNIWDCSTSTAKDDQSIHKINGKALTAYVPAEQDANDNVIFDYYNQSFTQTKVVRAKDITFEAYEGATRPTSGSYMVYYYNPYSRVITVVENLKVQNGTVENYYSGTQAYDSVNKVYYFSGATVTIDGTTYKLGQLRPGCDYMLNSVDGLTYIDSKNGDTLNKNAYDKDIAVAYANQKYQTLDYIVFDGNVIYAKLKGGAYDWVAFDYGKGVQTVNNYGYSTVTYEGDIVGVDANDNIVVKAYMADSSEKQAVAINEINGYAYGLLVADYAAIQYQYTGIGILQTGSYDVMIRKVIADFFKTLTADLTTDEEEKAGKEYHQLMYIVDSVDSDTGALNIYTDINLYYNANYIVSYRQPSYFESTNAKTVEATLNGVSTKDYVTFTYGISDVKVEQANGQSNGKYSVMILNDKSVVVVIGKDGIQVHTGVPANGTILNTAKATATTAGVRFYVLKNDYIVVASKDLFCNQIWSGKFDTEIQKNVWNYYLVVGNSTTNSAATTGYYMNDTQVSIKTNAAGQQVYTYTNMYHLNSGNLVSFEVVGGLKGYNSWTSALTGIKPIGAIYAEKNGEYKLLTPIDTTATNTGLADGYPSAKYSRYILEALLGTGYTDADGVFYDKVYSKTGKLSDTAAATPYYVNFTTGAGCFDTFAKTLDLIYYDYTGDAVTNIVLNATGISVDYDNSTSSKDLLGGNAYYEWTQDKVFTGVVVKGDAAPAGAVGFEAEVDKYVALLTIPTGLVGTDISSGNMTIAQHKAWYKTTYMSLTLDEIKARSVQDIKDWDAHMQNLLQNKQAAAEQTTLNNMRKAGKDAIDAAVAAAGLKDATNVSTLNTLASDKKAAIDSLTKQADVDAAVKAVTDKITELKAAEKAAADAAAKGVVKAENTANATVLTLQNVSDITFTGVEIFTVGANGLATKVATVALGATNSYADTATRGDVTVEWVRTGMNGVLTLKVADAFGVSAPVLAAGTYKFITTGDVIASGPITIG